MLEMKLRTTCNSKDPTGATVKNSMVIHSMTYVLLTYEANKSKAVDLHYLY